MFKLKLFQFLAYLSKRVQKYKSFLYWQEKFKVFFILLSKLKISISLVGISNNLRVLRGANVTSVFKSHKLF